jgi:hypothetical protein
MGGASGALRSDMGAIAVNPAAIVTYKTSELIFTPEFYRVQSTTNYHDQLNSKYKNDVNINNAGVVLSIQPRRSSTRYNFGFAYNKLNAFNANELIQNSTPVLIGDSYWGQIAKMENERDKRFVADHNHKPNGASGKYLFDADSTLPDGLLRIKQEAMYSAIGHMGEYALSFGANVSEKVYLGASVVVRDIKKSLVSQFREESAEDPDYQYAYNRAYDVSGLGFGGKVGILILPVPAFSMGLSVQTPIFYSLTRHSEGRINILPGKASFLQERGFIYDKDTTISYNLTTPLQLSLSLGYTFQGIAQITLDYDVTPYAITKYSNTEGDALILDRNNALLEANSKVGSSVRLGSEFYVWRGWVARLGGGYHTATSTWVKTAYNVGAGVGYDFGDTVIDLSYVYQQQNHEYYPLYTVANPSTSWADPVVKTTYTKQFIALSLAYRF